MFIFHRWPGQREVLSNRLFSSLSSEREWCRLGNRRSVCKLLWERQGKSSFHHGYEEVIKRWGLETCCCEVCALKWRDQRNCDSKVQAWTLVHLHQHLHWTRSQRPKPASQLSPLPVLSFDLRNESGRDEANAFQMKHTLENMLWEPPLCTPYKKAYSVHATL